MELFFKEGMSSLFYIKYKGSTISSALGIRNISHLVGVNLLTIGVGITYFIFQSGLRNSVTPLCGALQGLMGVWTSHQKIINHY